MTSPYCVVVVADFCTLHIRTINMLHHVTDFNFATKL